MMDAKVTELKMQQESMDNKRYSTLLLHPLVTAFDQRLLARVYKEIQLRRDPSHNFEHVMRVCRNAELIAKAEGGEMNIILPAALMHDLVVYPKASSKSSRSSDDSADLAEEILLDCGWRQDKIDQIGYCIRVHSFSKGLIPSTIEAKILQDADRLDALGAIGIARTFSIGGSENRSFYNPKDPFHELQRELSGQDWTLDHFYKKLLKLKNSMHTATARKLAQERTLFMRIFLEQMQKEVFMTLS